jgi:hypothetical protein
MTGYHSRSFAFDPEVLCVPFGGIAGFRDYFITSASADISRHNITGIPRFRTEATALDAITNLTTFQIGLPVVRAAAQ